MQAMNFDFHLPTRIVFGRGCRAKLPGLLGDLGAARVMVVTDRGLAGSGALDKLVKILDEARIGFVVFDEVEPAPTSATIDRGARVLQDKGCDAVLGIGGGSCLDAAKGVAIVAANGGSIADYYGLDKFSERPLPVVAMPTTAGTGSEVSTALSVRDPDTDMKYAVRSKMALPVIAALDPDLLSTLPARVAAECGMDALTHLMEAYVSKGASCLTDMMSLHGIRLAGKYLGAFVANRANAEAAENMLFASLLGGIVISYARTGAAHTVTRPLGHRLSHGVACAVVLPSVMEYNLISDVPKFVNIAEALGETTDGVNIQNAQRAVDAVRRLLQRLGIPPHLSSYGIEAEELPGVAENAATLEISNLNPRDLDRNAIESILRAAL